jgi:hypothetical protein
MLELHPAAAHAGAAGRAAHAVPRRDGSVSAYYTQCAVHGTCVHGHAPPLHRRVECNRASDGKTETRMSRLLFGDVDLPPVPSQHPHGPHGP